MLRFTNIVKKYDKQKIIDNITFEVKKGEVVVLIGPSGCGKTTLLKMINRLIKQTSGDIYIDNVNILEKNEIDLRRNIGYVIQQTGLFPHMTVRENIEIVPRLLGKSKEEIENKSVELMNMVSLSPSNFLDRFPVQLSGGQQQRVGVARAFACDPEIILMDEPFSALDPITKNELQEELVDLQSRMKKTIIFVTHDMEEAIKIGDRICIMNGGKIVQYDTPEEIMKNPANNFVEEFIGKNRIWSSPEFIRASDIMIHNPVCIYPDATALRCIEKMRTAKVDSLLIIDKDKKLLGVVGAKYIRSLLDKTIKVSSIMSQDFEKVKLDDSIIEILQRVNDEQYSLSTIPVVDDFDHLEGLITKSSLITTLSQQYIETSEVL